MMWVCASMKPGSSVASPSSMTRAPAGSLTVPRRPTAVILSSVTTTKPFWMGAVPVPSITRAAWRMTVPLPFGSCCAAAVQATVMTSNAPTAARFDGKTNMVELRGAEVRPPSVPSRLREPVRDGRYSRARGHRGVDGELDAHDRAVAYGACYAKLALVRSRDVARD